MCLDPRFVTACNQSCNKKKTNFFKLVEILNVDDVGDKKYSWDEFLKIL